MQTYINQNGKYNVVVNGNVDSLNMSTPSEIPHSLTVLPNNGEDSYVERDELVDFLNIINTERKVVLINGIGGVGKTTFVKMFLFKTKALPQKIVGNKISVLVRF
jgi:MoxR-like ATPase